MQRFTRRVVRPADVSHGTNATFMRHLRRGERPCAMCRDAHNAYDRARRAKLHGPRESWPLDWAKCGTPSQARAHYQRGEKPCEACRLAHNQWMQDHRPSRAKDQAA